MGRALGPTVVPAAQRGGSGRSGGGDADATTLIAAMSPAPDAARQTLISDLIAGLKADGVWAKLDVLYVPAAHAQQGARLNWKDPALYALVTSGTTSFTIDRGFTTNGGTGYLDTNWKPGVNGVQYTKNSAHMLAWCQDAPAQNSSGYIISAFTSGQQTRILPNNGSGQTNGNINSSGNFGYTFTDATYPAGLYGIQRGSASFGIGVKNAVFSTNNDAIVSIGSPLFNMLILGFGNNASSGSTPRIAQASAGAYLSQVETTAYKNRLQTYMTAVGA